MSDPRIQQVVDSIKAVKDAGNVLVHNDTMDTDISLLLSQAIVLIVMKMPATEEGTRAISELTLDIKAESQANKTMDLIEKFANGEA